MPLWPLNSCALRHQWNKLRSVDQVNCDSYLKFKYKSKYTNGVAERKEEKKLKTEAREIGKKPSNRWPIKLDVILPLAQCKSDSSKLDEVFPTNSTAEKNRPTDLCKMMSWWVAQLLCKLIVSTICISSEFQQLSINYFLWVCCHVRYFVPAADDQWPRNAFKCASRAFEIVIIALTRSQKLRSHGSREGEKR